MANILVRFITKIMDSMSDVSEAQREDSGGPMYVVCEADGSVKAYTDYRTYEERVAKPISEAVQEMEKENKK